MHSLHPNVFITKCKYNYTLKNVLLKLILTAQIEPNCILHISPILHTCIYFYSKLTNSCADNWLAFTDINNTRNSVRIDVNLKGVIVSSALQTK